MWLTIDSKYNKAPLIMSLSFLVLIACNDPKKEISTSIEEEMPLAQITEESYQIRNDSVIFSSATIEIFDPAGNSQEVYWLNEEKDTTLKFYRKYDADGQLIGAEYFEEGDDVPSRDTVYFNDEGLKVEASLNDKNQISWKSTTTPDEKGNPVLKTYENSKGEYRGLDSLFFDENNREVKGFYKYASGKRGKVRTYEYLEEDPYGNWTERTVFFDDTLRQKQVRILRYHLEE